MLTARSIPLLCAAARRDGGHPQTKGILCTFRTLGEMAVTNKRVVVKVGLLRKRTIELFLSKVEKMLPVVKNARFRR